VIVRDAETRSREIIETGRQTAVRESQELLARLRREAEQERARQVDAVKGGGAELLAGKTAEIETAAAEVLGIITGTHE
jgi:vacuolar-type H+-ATPase subunit H